MDSKFLAVLCVAVMLCGCGWLGSTADDGLPKNDKGYEDTATTNYWFPTHVTADNVPNVVKSQEMLEDDMVACGYEIRDHRRWAQNNDPVSNSQGDVVDHRGVNRAETSLPTTFELADCMQGKGWVRLKHYYTAPY